MSDKFSVIVPCYKNPEYLDLCLKSIVEGQVTQNEIIVVLDGFVELYAGFEARHPKVNFLPLYKNMGMQYAINIGVFNASNERIFIVNDDNVFPRKWDEKLKPALNGSHVYDIVTVDQIEPTGPGMFNFDVKDCGRTVKDFSFELFDKACEEFDKPAPSPTIHDSSTNDGRIFPFIISKRDFMIVNGFDTFYQSPNVVDWDFFLKLELLGRSFSRIHTAHLYHFGSVATKKNPDAPIFVDKEQKAFATFHYKWGFYPSNGINNTKLPKEPIINGIKYS